MNQNRLIARFATAYQSLNEATATGNESSRLVWLDIYVDCADQLGLQDEDHIPLKDARDEKRRRDEDFMANYREIM